MNRLITEDERSAAAGPRPGPRRWQAIDPVPVVRLFTPDAHATWLLAALDPADGDTAWGLIDLGIGMPELGTVKLSDLAVHRRAAPAAGDARSVFPAHAHAVGIHPAGRGDGAIPD
jgi:hypothetical protein